MQQGSLSDVERAKNKVSNKILRKIHEVYSINPDWIMTGEGEMFDKIQPKPGGGEKISSGSSNEMQILLDNIELLKKLNHLYEDRIEELENKINLLEKKISVS